MAESAVFFLCNQLSRWLQQERQLLGGFVQEVEYIRDEMGHMKAFLRVADANEEIDPQLKEWVKQVREIAYDTEDVLNEYMLRFALGRAIGHNDLIKKVYYTIKNLKFRHQIVSEIKKIKIRVENVSKSQQRYKDMCTAIQPGSSYTLNKNTWYDGRGDALLLEETDVVGIEEPKKELLDSLSPTDFGLKVISVVGMGGLGKTTLVKKVYDDASLKSKFDHRVWITVSESFKLEHLLRRMIRQLVDEVKRPLPHGLEVMNANEMKEFIYEFLEDKIYLFVLDDVWQIHVWEAIRYALPRSNSRGCVVITTRDSRIGNVACSKNNGFVYDMKALQPEESKKLFYKKAFQGNSCPFYLKGISECILRKCAGLPLAIVVIGGLLTSKNSEEWEIFSHSLGDEEEGDSVKRMMKILSLGYYDLPYNLKSCFLYLSIFPEDELFDIKLLIRLWIAEGFVEPKQGMTVEEVAETYVRELLDRSLIKVAETYLDGRPYCFQIHDLIRQYIISKAREHNVTAIFRGEDVRWPDKVRCVASHTSINYMQEYDSFKYLRSFMWFGTYVDANFAQIIGKVLDQGNRQLKVLHLNGAPVDVIPREVFKCYHLKYMCLRETQVQHIPKSIKNFLNLETLDLRGTNVTELPIEILNLHRLRHLLAYKVRDNLDMFDIVQSFKAPYMIGNSLLSLQTLVCIDADEVNGIKIVREIGKLTQLRSVSINKLKRKDGNGFCSSLSKLINLRRLSIYSIEEGEIIDLDYSLSPPTLPYLQMLTLHGRLDKVPRWIPCLQRLTELDLLWSRLTDNPLEYIEDLPNLEGLRMYRAYEGEGLHFKAKGFQRLKKLVLYNLRGLRWVMIDEGCMPFLEKLFLFHIRLMMEVPKGIEHLHNLQEVKFIDMTGEFLTRLDHQKRRGGEDWKLAHVPTILVFNAVNGEWELQDFGQPSPI